MVINVFFVVLYVFLVDATIIVGSSTTATSTSRSSKVHDVDEQVVDRTKQSKLRFKSHPRTNSTDYKILLESFTDPKHEWAEMNDPVMGGKSTGSFHIDAKDGIGIFSGQVNNVPFLHAPGFIQVRTTIMASSIYPDISHCNAFELIVASQFPQYPGYRMSFGTQHAPHGKMFAYGYKTHFTFETDDVNNTSLHTNSTAVDSRDNMTFQSIILPFHRFTDFWDDATGDAIIECHPDDPNDRIYCPTPQALYNIQTIGLWGEGYVGDVNINIQAIYAIQCNDDDDDDDNVVDDDGEVYRNELNVDVTTKSTSWWSWVEQLLFGDSKADKTTTSAAAAAAAASSSSSSSLSSKTKSTATTTTTTSMLQRNMLLSSIYQHRW